MEQPKKNTTQEKKERKRGVEEMEGGEQMIFTPEAHDNNPNEKGIRGFNAEEWEPMLVVELQDGLTKGEQRVYRKAMKKGRLFQAWGWLIVFNETGTGISVHPYDRGNAHKPLKRMRHNSKSNNTLYERFVESINKGVDFTVNGDYSCTTAHHMKLNKGGNVR